MCCVPQKHGKQHNTHIYIIPLEHDFCVLRQRTEFPWKITRKLWQARFIICHENFMSTKPSRYPLRLLLVRLHSNPIKFDVHIATATATAAAMGKYVFSFTSSTGAAHNVVKLWNIQWDATHPLTRSAAQLISHCHHLRVSHTGRSCRYLPNMHILTLTHTRVMPSCVLAAVQSSFLRRIFINV